MNLYLRVWCVCGGGNGRERVGEGDAGVNMGKEQWYIYENLMMKLIIFYTSYTQGCASMLTFQHGLMGFELKSS